MKRLFATPGDGAWCHFCRKPTDVTTHFDMVGGQLLYREVCRRCHKTITRGRYETPLVGAPRAN